MALSDLQGLNPMLEDYLEHLIAPLVGLVPYEQRFALRLETQEHLEVRVSQLERDGLGVEEATREAIRRYGSAHQVAERFLTAWFENELTSPLTRRIGRANGIAFSRFVLAHLGYVVLLQALVFLPSGAAYALPMSPAEMRRIVPEPLPLPDQPWAMALIYAYPVLAPMVAGWLTGLAVPVGSARAVYNAVLPLSLYSFVVGALMVPMTAGLLFGLFQVVFWLPVGALAACLGSSFHHARALRREAFGG